MINRVFIIIFILLLNVSCKKDETLTAFEVNNKKIEDSNENLNIKNESFLEAIYIQAEKNDELIDRKETAKQVHAIGVDFYKYIEDLKVAIKTKNSTQFVNELFFNGEDITQEGEEFLMYIKNYSSSMNTTLQNTNPRIVGMVNNNFDLSVIEDRRGQKTNWLNLNFKDFSPIISIIKLSTMQADIRRIETQYLAELLGVKLNSSTKKVIEKIKAETSKQISENTSPLTESKDDLGLDTKKIIKDDELNIDNTTINTKSEIEKIEPKKVEPKKEITKIVPKTIVKKAKKRTHTVKSGENLYRISLKYKISLKKLKKLNGMTNNNVVRGQVLKVE